MSKIIAKKISVLRSQRCFNEEEQFIWGFFKDQLLNLHLYVMHPFLALVFAGSAGNLHLASM